MDFAAGDGGQMNTWYSVSLGDGIMSAMPSAEIEELFQSLYTSSGQPIDMAVFTRSESEGRLHCEVIAYFSPSASKVAQAFDAEPCLAPARSGLGLLAGDPACWSVLLPDETA